MLFNQNKVLLGNIMQVEILKQYAEGIPCNLLIWWLCKNGTPSPCLFVAHGCVVCLGFAWWTRQGDELALYKTSIHNLYCSLYFSLSSLPNLDSSHCLFWHFKKPCQFPVFTRPNKMLCLVTLYIRCFFSQRVHKKMIVAFGFVLSCCWMSWLFSTFHTQQSRLSSNI